MAIKLTNVPTAACGGLWFEFPEDLQPYVIPWLKSMLHNVDNVQHRQLYRRQLTKAAKKEKYGRSIFGRSDKGGGNTWCIYTCFGKWRVGDRGLAAYMMETVKEDILESLTVFSQVMGPREIQATPFETVLAQVGQSSGIAVLP